MKKNILILIAIIVVAVGCTKSDENLVKENHYSLKVSNEFELIEDDMIDSIGKMHNEMMDLVLSNFNYDNVSSDNRIERMKDAFLEVSYYEATDEFEELIYDTVQIWNVNLSEDAIFYLNKITDIINTSSNYITIEENLISLKNEVESNSDITLLDKQSIKIGISIGINSSYYWLPLDQGGSGKGQSYLGQLYPAKEMSPKGKKIATADVGGGLTGGIGWCGAAVFGGPAGLGAFVGGILYGAASASLLAAAGV